MKLFVDSADVEEIREMNGCGMLDGVTTNPSLIKKSVEKLKGGKVNLDSYLRRILKLCKGKPVSLEVTERTFDGMTREGTNLFRKFNATAKNVWIKIPVNPCLEAGCPNYSDGIKTIKKLSARKIPVNCTLIFTPEQALLAAKAGAKAVSLFVGRVDDYVRETNGIEFGKEDYFPEKGFKKGKKILQDDGIVSGVDLVRKCVETFGKRKLKSEILAASIRNPRQFREVAEAGADVATLPFGVMKELLKHEKTAEGMKKFTKDVVPEYAELAGK